METSSSVPDPREEILAQFIEELDRRGSQAIDDYLRRYPDLAGRIHDLVKARKAVQQTRPPAEPGLPARLGEFRIVREIGHGGMGRIYEAVQERLNRRVALKVIRHGRVLPEARDRFLREQEILARLHQTNIVAIHTAGEEGPLQYFAMPYIEGAALQHVVRTVRHLETSQPGSKTPSLAQLAGILADGKPPADASGASLPVSTPTGSPGNEIRGNGQPAARPARLVLSPAYYRSVAEVLADAAEALHHAHGVGILHRDVKPLNLMVDKSGRCWLIDFGLAGYLAGNPGAGAPASPSPFQGEGRTEGQTASREPVTVSGIMGTPQYMAPEQFAGKADVRADVWGLGATLYELLTLRPAYDGKAFDEIRGKVVSGQPTPPRQLVRNVPRDLAAICRKAMSERPGDRYQTAQEFTDDLRSWLRGEPTVARPARLLRCVWLWSKRNRGWAAAIILMIFAVVALAGAEIRSEKIKRSAAEVDAVAARQREADRHREYLLQQLQYLRLGLHFAGWSEDAWERVRAIAKIRTDDDLRNQAAGTFVGIDARVTKRFQEFGAASVDFSRDGKRLLLGGYEGQGAKIWNGTTEALISFQDGGPGPVMYLDNDTPLHLTPNPKDRQSLLLWDLGKERPIREFKIPTREQPQPFTIKTLPRLAIAPGGRYTAASVAFRDGKGAVFVWEVASGKLLHEFAESARALAFSPDASLLAFADTDGRIHLRSLPKGDLKDKLDAGRRKINCLAFGREPRWGAGPQRSATGLMLAAGESGGTVVVWDSETKIPRTYCYGATHEVYALAFSPDGTALASGERHGATKLWDVATGRLLLVLRPGPNDNDFITAVAFSRDGKDLAVSSRTGYTPGKVCVWRFANGRGIQTLRGLIGQIAQVRFSPNGRLLAALSHDWHIGIWDLRSGHLQHVLTVQPGYWADNAAMAFNTDGSQFAASSGTQAKLWDLATGKERPWDLPPGMVDVLAFHPSGKLLLFREETKDGKDPPLDDFSFREHPRVCRIRDLLGPKSTEPFAEIDDYSRDVIAAVVASDGSYFAVDGWGGRDGKERWIKAFDGPTGKALWSVRSTRTHENMTFTVDDLGKALSYGTDDTGMTTLVEMGCSPFSGPLEMRVRAYYGP